MSAAAAAAAARVCSWVPKAEEVMNDGELNSVSFGTERKQRGSTDEMILSPVQKDEEVYT